ncbi:hypothetical protein [Microvirga makkahensis]|uniref:Uncharacterized protein n=1 Tax=Microvirga makkahensis TaxID=1128670 RepID=A0A7X3SR06_9HYPH|nr:hypothetical protein [Microvirga makkahensis]MXQ14042.1 hypothetical protein [Microvirga makkahensis]
MSIGPIASWPLRSRRISQRSSRPQGVLFQQDQVLYVAGDPLRYAYFPNDTAGKLVAVLKDGRSGEMAAYAERGRWALCRGRLIILRAVRCASVRDGLPDRAGLPAGEVIGQRRKIRQLELHFAEAMMSRVLLNVACNPV